MLAGTVAAQQPSCHKTCVIVHELHKAGTATLQKLLYGVGISASTPPVSMRERPYRYWCDGMTFIVQNESCTDTKKNPFTKQIEVAPHLHRSGTFTLLHGTYVPILRAWHPSLYGKGHCRALVLVREPLARLASAFTYCKFARLDPLCANKIHWNRASIESFAKHWGNYLLRELLFAEWPEQGARCGLRCQANATSPRLARTALESAFVPVWFLLKLALNGGDDVSTPKGQAALHRVTSRLRSGEYAAIGIMEHWNASMRNFDAAFPLNHGASWRLEMGRSTVTHHARGDKWKSDEARFLEEARTSSKVRGLLAGDLHLYHHVLLPLFGDQLRMRGIHYHVSPNMTGEREGHSVVSVPHSSSSMGINYC
jgi:hypothetical protein